MPGIIGAESFTPTSYNVVHDKESLYPVYYESIDRYLSIETIVYLSDHSGFSEFFFLVVPLCGQVFHDTTGTIGLNDLVQRFSFIFPRRFDE